MAGTNRIPKPKLQAVALAENGPGVNLNGPQTRGKIRMGGGAMLNCGLTDLRLVRPRVDWPNEKAARTSAGADLVLNQVRLFDLTEEAIADLSHVYASTARRRDMTMTVLTPAEAAREMHSLSAENTPSGSIGVIFGGEAMGLNNDDVVLADKIITTPLNPGFSSLNLSQAVLIVAYEWLMLIDKTPARELVMSETRPANKSEMAGLFEHLERELDNGGFLRVREKRPIMVRNLRIILQRADLTEQEVRTLRGVIKCLTGTFAKKVDQSAVD